MFLYYVSWSPKRGEATYTRVFDSAAERDKFAHDIAHMGQQAQEGGPYQ